jgi:hypothetical protein
LSQISIIEILKDIFQKHPDFKVEVAEASDRAKLGKDLSKAGLGIWNYNGSSSFFQFQFCGTFHLNWAFLPHFLPDVSTVI